MGDLGEATTAQQPKVTSQQHEQLLDTIDRIRAQGISRYIDIPQIVVCGDQSSGKWFDMADTTELICSRQELCA